MPSLCGFRLWRSKTAVSATSAPDHDQRPARPFSGETMVGSISNLDAASVEEGKVTDKRTISGRFLSVGAALRERSRSPSGRSPYQSNSEHEKPTVTIPGPYSKDYGLSHRASAGRIRSESITSLDTPTSPEDEKRWHNRDSKMKEESPIEETEEEARLRKMAEARRKFAQQQKEQERLDDFQLM
ncbi:hypothetical protein DL546_004668 [Coniochaeta pulveracea]|uniref:Uncharacterized protein n=1 Tax=Coniochaeta pulveracea TaxID=177199 RepID=A0A420Y3S3_9PEZI|nr:hypothetical protein DL546_004668 [Coniochaeta pulveracea]